MYGSKKEVDIHVRTALSKIKSEKDRALRGLTIAKLYIKIKEFATAEQFISSYLGVKDDNDQAHKMLGQCYQALNQPKKALQAFQRSLQLNQKQPDLLAEVCQLLVDDDQLNPNKAKYWCDLAEASKVQSESVYSLRMKLMTSASATADEIESMLRKEIIARPDDVAPRVRLVRHFVDQQQVLDAFKYVHEFELTLNEAFSYSSEWYNMVWLVLSKYEQLPDAKKDWDFWFCVGICLERLVFISFMTPDTGSGNTVTETANILFRLDQYLYKITKMSEKFQAQPEFVSLYLEHYCGLLLFHAVCLIFKRELLHKKSKWRDTMQLVFPLLLLTYHINPREYKKDSWMKHCDETSVKFIKLWHREGAFRAAQSGRILLSCVMDEDKENVNVNEINSVFGNAPGSLCKNNEELIALMRQICADKEWKRKIFPHIFCNSDQRLKEQTSLIVRCASRAEPIYELPTVAHLEGLEEIAQYLRPQSLRHMVYVYLNHEDLSHVRAQYFSGLNLSVSNLAFCGAESLNQLDMDSFLYASIIETKRTIEVNREAAESTYGSTASIQAPVCHPRLFPFVNMQHDLCSDEQITWWTIAYRVYKNLSTLENAAQTRADLQQGLEVIRGINGPKMDMLIVFKLGKIFAKRAKEVTKPVERSFLEARAECLYLHGLKMFKLHNRAVLEPFRKTFKYKASEEELFEYSENAVLYLADRMIKKAQYEELIEEMKDLALPFAAYKQAEAYRRMAEGSKTSKISKQRYTERAVECLQQALELLKNTKINTNHPLNTTINTELKRMQHNAKKFNESRQTKDDALDSSFLSEIGVDAATSTADNHNNSSTYEDALTQIISPLVNRSLQQRQSGAGFAATTTTPARSEQTSNKELEALMKQMASTLTLVREEMRQEMHALKDEMVNHFEDMMRKFRINSFAPAARCDGCPSVGGGGGLDDMYLTDDAIQQQQLFTQPSQNFLPNTMLNNHASTPNNFGGSLQQQNPSQPLLPAPLLGQQRLPLNPPQPQPPSGSTQMQSLAYNTPICNPNHTFNCYGNSFPPLLPPRGQMNLPFADSTPNGMNLNMLPSTPLFPPVPSGQGLQPAPLQSTLPDGRSNNMFSLLNQPQPPTTPAGPPMALAPQPPPLAPLNSLPTLSSALSMPPQQPVTPLMLNPPPLTTNVGASFNKALNNQPVEKGPPANVVITSSDPLPNPRNANQLQMQQPTLSVTIPSHHIKPSLVQATEMAAPPFGGLTQPPPLAPMNNLGGGNVGGGGGGPAGLFASNNNSFGNNGFGNNGFGGNNSLNNSFSLNNSTSFSFGGVAGGGGSSSNQNSFSTANKDATANFLSTFSFKPAVEKAMAANNSASSVSEKDNSSSIVVPLTESALKEFNKSLDAETAEYDPRPDFQAIIPLPAEIEVCTGEEDEDVMFVGQAKLYRFVGKEWRERGSGTIKILKNKENQSSRVLMRRDQTHKICANHKITKDLKLIAKTEKCGHTWAAPDFADGEMKSEIFYIRFKEKEMAQKFHDAFIQAQKDDERAGSSGGKEKKEKENPTVEKPKSAVEKAKPAEEKEKEKPAAVEKEKPAFGLSKSAAVVNFASSTPVGKPDVKSNTDQRKPTKPPVTANENKSIFGALNLTGAVSTTTATTPATSTPNPFAAFKFGAVSSSASTTSSSVVASSVATPISASIFGKSTESPFSIANLKFPSFGSPSQVSSNNEASTPASSSSAAAPPPPPNTLNKSNASDTEDEYVPTAQFKPVIALPDLVEVTTGEECYKQLFEHRAKLLRFDKETREWKERGIGNARLLQHKENKDDVRLVMRREQIHKLCCNQRIYKDTEFKYAKSSQTALQWVGLDYSESELTTELLTLRFKTPEICKDFYDTLLSAQSEMSENVVMQADGEGEIETAEADSTTKSNNNTSKEESPATTTTNETKGFGDAFKPKAGSWTCNGCYIINPADESYCPSCETPKDDTVPKKEAKKQEPFDLTTKTTFTFGFNNATSAPPAAPTTLFGLPNTTTNSSGATKGFNFGMPTTTAAPVSKVPESISTTTTTTAGTANKTNDFGGKFKSKPGSWDCPDCYTHNEADKSYCAACEAPKDSSIPKKEVSTGGDANKNILALSDPTQKFSFGFPTNTAATTATTSVPTLGKPTFSFNLQSKSTAPTESSPFSSPFSLNKKDFTFTMSSSKSSDTDSTRPVSLSDSGAGGGKADTDADDGDHLHEEEENNTYFTPVIPLPDKIDVKTGEEDEDTLYAHRAKLYRFADGEWKERGIGDVKILRHKQTKKLRVIMRRDQVHKICLNHALNEDVEYKAKDEKSWLFVVNDFSEGEVQMEKLSLRFKTKEIASDFMNAIKKALSEVGEAAPSSLGLNGHHAAEKSSEQKSAVKEKEKTESSSSIDKKTTANIARVKPKWPLEQPELKSPESSSQSLRSFSFKQSGLLAPPQLKPAEPKTPADDAVKSPPISFSFKAALKENEDAKPKNAASGGFLFGSGDSTSGVHKFGSSIFGGGAVSSNQPLFGQPATLFGNVNAAMPKDAAQSGKTTTTGNESKFIFGEKTENASAPAAAAPPSSGGLTSIFGGGVATEPKPTLFGTTGNANAAASIFDATKIGGNATTGNQQQQQQQKSIFGSNNAGVSIFGGGTASFLNTNKSGGSLFGGNFTDKPATDSGNSNSNATDTAKPFSFADFSTKASGMDFASLAASSNKDNLTAKTEKPGPGGFIGLTNQDAFSSFLTPAKDKNANNDGNGNSTAGDENNAAEDENYDPHYEPIIPLPKEIVVSTGEEEEEKIFSERAVLFRYDADNKEWKERGVGEIKLLVHTKTKRYRLLLRREQVHKLVLNFPLSESFKFNTMKNNPRSFLFVGMNFAESNVGAYEKLALRFKKLDTAEQFSRKLNSCLEVLQQNANAN